MWQQSAHCAPVCQERHAFHRPVFLSETQKEQRHHAFDPRLFCVALSSPFLHGPLAGPDLGIVPTREWQRDAPSDRSQPTAGWEQPLQVLCRGFHGLPGRTELSGVSDRQDFAQGFPLQARFRLARTSVEPGSAPDARRIFINDATNGTPKEAGNTWDMGLDGLYPMGDRTHFFGGVRYSRFKANFKYVGGNEDFDVTSSHWGLAAGLEAEFPMGSKMSLLLAGGGSTFSPPDSRATTPPTALTGTT